MTGKVHFQIVNREGAVAAAEGTVGDSLMETIRKNGFDELQAICGGCCSCATCHVFIDPETPALQPRSWEEEMLLEGSSHFSDRSRLSCQIRVAPEHGGMRVEIAPED